MRARSKARGLSEVLGALIVLVALSGVAVGIAKVISKEGESVASAGTLISKRLEEEMYRPVLSVDLINKTLYLRVYTFRPLKISYVLYYFPNGTYHLIKLNKLITGNTSIPIIKNYRCEPLRILVATPTGVTFYYTPMQDPRLASLGQEALKFMERRWIDCDLINALKANGSRTLNSEKLQKDPVTGSYLLNYDPDPVETFRKSMNLSTSFEISGDFSSNYASLTVTYNGKRYGLGLGSSVKIESFTDPWGHKVDIYVRDVYAGSSSGILLTFRSNGLEPGEALIYFGNVSISYHASYSGYYWISLGRYSYTLPLILSEVSNATSTTSGYEESSGSLWKISLSSYAEGSFETESSLLLIFSTDEYYSLYIDAKVSVNLKGVVLVKGINTTMALDFRPPFHYRLKPVSVNLKEALSSFVKEAWSLHEDEPLLKIKYGNLTTYRDVTERELLAPIKDANYSIILKPYLTLPFLTSLNEDFTMSTHSGETYRVNFWWAFSTELRPSGIYLPWPYLIFINDSAGLRYLVILDRVEGNIRVVQFNKSYDGYGVLLSEMPVKVLNNWGSAELYAIKLDDKETYYNVQVNLIEPSIYYLGKISKGKDSINMALPPGVYELVIINDDSNLQLPNDVVVYILYVY